MIVPVRFVYENDWFTGFVEVDYSPSSPADGVQESVHLDYVEMDWDDSLRLLSALLREKIEKALLEFNGKLDPGDFFTINLNQGERDHGRIS